MSCTAADLTALRLAGSPTLAPGGTTAVAVVQSIDPNALRYRSRLFLYGSDELAVPLTESGAWSDTAPSYSPDGGAIAFVSTRDGQRQAYLLYPGTGRLRSLGRVDGEVVALVWTDRDTVLGVVEHSQQDNGSGAPVVLDWLHYKRDGETGFLEPVHELWAFGPSTTPRLVHRPDGRVSCLTAGNGGAGYVLDARHTDETTPPVEVRWLDVAGGSDRLLWRCPSKVSGLAVTGSGELVAVASAAAGQSATPPRLWLLDGTGSARALFPGVDLEVERSVIGDCRPRAAPGLLRSVDGTDEVLFLVATGDDIALYQGNPADAKPRRLTPAGVTVTDFSAARAGRVAVCVESPVAPVELRLVDLDSPSVAAATGLNTRWAAEAAPVAPETVTLSDGTLHGLLYRPPGAGPGPLVVRVHGGPHLSFGTAFDLETQILLSAGYRVLLPNVRGSSGRGAEFRAASVGQWGDGDYTDLMAFVDWAVERGVADPDRLYLAGGSYGGYLINWTLTRTNRFRAAISERTISNLLSKYGTSDNGSTVNRFEMGGADLFDDGVQTLLERSPLRHAPNITTPLLLIHGENDYRCPIEQSEQLFTALRRLGREVRFIRFPAESHALALTGRPDHRTARLTHILTWLQTH